MKRSLFFLLLISLFLFFQNTIFAQTEFKFPNYPRVSSQNAKEIYDDAYSAYQKSNYIYAIKNWSEILSIYHESGLYSSVITILKNIAISYDKTKDKFQSLYFYKLSFDYALQFGEIIDLKEALQDYTELLSSYQLYSEVKSAYEKAYQFEISKGGKDKNFYERGISRTAKKVQKSEENIQTFLSNLNKLSGEELIKAKEAIINDLFSVGKILDAISYTKEIYEFYSAKNNAEKETESLIKLSQGFTFVRIFNLPFNVETSNKTKSIDLSFRILELEYTEDGYAVAKISGGTNDGIIKGLTGKILGIHMAEFPSRGGKYIGGFTVIEEGNSISKILIMPYILNSEADAIYLTDVAEIAVSVPSDLYSGLYLKLLGLGINFLDINGDLIADPLVFRLFQDKKFESRLFELLALDIIATYETIKDTDLDDWTMKRQKGLYKGYSMLDVMSKATSEDIENFFIFVKEYPGKYIGRSWKVNETFATWLINDSPLSAEILYSLLTKAKNENEFKQIVNDNRDLIINDKFVKSWNSTADDIMEDKLDSAIVLNNMSLRVIEIINDPVSNATTYYTKAKIHEAKKEEKQALEYFKKSAQEFDKTTEYLLAGICYHNLGWSLYNINEFDGAEKSFSKSIELKKKFLYENPNERSVYGNIGVTLWAFAFLNKKLGNNELALQQYFDAIAYYDSSDSKNAKKNITSIYDNISKLYKSIGDYRNGIKYSELSLKYYLENNLIGEAGDALDEIGYNYFQLGDYNIAIEKYNLAYAKHLEAADTNSAGFSKSNVGQAYWNLGKYNEAVEAHREAIKLREIAKNISGQAYSWNKIAGLYKESGEPRLAIDAYTKALNAYIELNDTSGLATVYNNIGDLYKDLKEFDKAIEFYQKSLEQKELVNNKADLAEYYFNIGLTYYDLRKYDLAYTNLNKSREIEKQLGNKSGELYSLVNIAMIEYSFRRNFESAIEMFNEAMRLANEIESTTNLAYVYKNFGRLYYEKAETEKSYKYYDSALTLYKQLGEKTNEAFILIDIGYYFVSKGKFDDARRLFNEALNIGNNISNKRVTSSAESAIGELLMTQGNYSDALKFAENTLNTSIELENEWGVASAYISLGNIYNVIGEYQKAMDYYKKADSMYIYLDSRYSRTTPMNNIGTIYFWQGDYAKSLAQFEETIQILEEMKFEGEFYPIVIGNIGEIYFYMKKYDEAIKWIDKALNFARKLESTRIISSELTMKGKFEIEMGKLDEAEKNLIESYTLLNQMGERERMAEVSGLLGKLYYKKGNFEKASQYLSESIALSKAVGTTRFLYEPLYLSALLKKKDNKIEESINLLRDAVSVVEQIRNKIVGGEEARKLFSTGEEKAIIYETIITLFIQKGEIDSAMFYFEKSNNEALRQLFGQRDLQFDDENKNKALQQEKDLKLKIDGVNNELVKEQSKPEELQNKEKIQKLLETKSIAENDYINFIQQTVEDYPDLSDYFKNTVNPTSFLRNKGRIPDDVAVVAYLMGDNQLYVFVASKEAVNAKVIEISRNDLEKKVVKLYRFLKDSSIPQSLGEIDPKTMTVKDKSKELEFETHLKPFMDLSSELFDILIAPIQDEIKGKSKLSIIPYGKLYYLPFESLADNNNNNFSSFLGEEYSIFYISSLDVFSNDPAMSGDLKLIAFGNADNTLPNAEIEVKDLKQIFTDTEIYLRDDASKDRVKKIKAPFNAIHFATHGNLDYSKPNESYLTLAGGDNGKLTIKEINSLTNLYNFNLVTLSACKTAVSEELVKGWYINPANAFFEVGVRTVVASLWQVDDEATSLLMKSFYENLKTMNKIEALRKAKISLSKNPKYAYPYYWSSFILVGDYD